MRPKTPVEDTDRKKVFLATLSTLSRESLAGGILFLLLLAGCASLPTDYERHPSETMTDTADTQLGVAVAHWIAAHDGKAGFYPLPEGLDALGARLALIDLAERGIDMQYFLMKPDDAGFVVADKLSQAADRGVRVRFLLDDIFTTVKDESLLALDDHPNIEIRLFNPVARGGIGWLSFLMEFKRANRRMHNKSFTVDNQATIVGGRNIAQEYFQLKSASEFVDFDVLGFGPVAADVSETFDTFWNHPLAMPLSAFATGPDSRPKDRANTSRALDSDSETIYEEALDAPLVQDLLQGRARLYPADAEVITDDPEKLLHKISPDHQLLVTRMAEIVDAAKREVIVISPYFIPGNEGVEYWKRIVDKGVRVIVLTNSLASTNHPAVHSAYSRYRKKLLAAGVELFEARANAAAHDPSTGTQLNTLTLHTKAVLIDGRYTFVGSLNLDPRSIDINTEMGLLIDSAEMSAPLSASILRDLPGFSYRLTLTDDRQLLWHAEINGKQVTEIDEPLARGWLKLKAFLLKIVPESQL
jgi:putative cardiolipin synthase